MLELHTLPKRSGKTKNRVGRGNASGGNYSGRGMKGQRSRSGGKGGLKLRGLKQSMMAQKKNRGFTSPHAKMHAVNLAQLEATFDAGTVVTPEMMATFRLVPTPKSKVKVLGNGTLTKKLTVSAHAFSESATTAIAAAGGEAQVIASTKYVRPKK